MFRAFRRTIGRCGYGRIAVLGRAIVFGLAASVALAGSVRAQTDSDGFLIVTIGSDETIREVAAELLAEDPGEVTRRHARYFAQLAHELAERAVARADHAAAATLTLELDNLIAAHAHAVAAGDADLARTIALAVDPVLATRGDHRLRLRLLDATLALTSDALAFIARA